MKILAVNAGSSSVKLQVFAMEGGMGQALAKAARERIVSHEAAIADALAELDPGHGIAAVGHRVVHGGEYFRESVVIDETVERRIDELGYLAPLHNPANLAGIRACAHLLPGIPQVAVFDTAFHATIPPEAYTYALPRELAAKWHIRRYGFHGTSHRYLMLRYAEMRGGRPEDFNLITLHLGNGCSACAIRKGRAVDSSMGMTPMEGLVMGTRAGDLDPVVPLRLQEWEGLSAAAVDELLNKRSGLLGLSGESNDMRELLASASSGAKLAVDVFCHRIVRYVGAFHAVVGGADALVFSGGIGENSVEIRERITAAVAALRIPEVIVIPTNEELLIARDTEALCRRG